MTSALDTISRDFSDLDAFIIDIRNCPGGEDSTAISIINRFCDRRRVGFRRQTKIGPGENDFTPLKAWHIEPHGDAQFNGPSSAADLRFDIQRWRGFRTGDQATPHVTIIGEHTNGIFSYQLEKKLPNGWRYSLSYQKYLSADKVCYEGKGVPVDIKLLNSKADIVRGIDPLISRALKALKIRKEKSVLRRKRHRGRRD